MNDPHSGSWDCEQPIAQMKAIGLALQYYEVATVGLPPAPRPNHDDDPGLYFPPTVDGPPTRRYDEDE